MINILTGKVIKVYKSSKMPKEMSIEKQRSLKNLRTLIPALTENCSVQHHIDTAYKNWGKNHYEKWEIKK